MRKLLGRFPQDRLTIMTSAYNMENLSNRGYAGGLLDVPHIVVHPWRSSLRGTHRLLRCLSVAKIMVGTAVSAALRARRDTTILALPYGAEYGSELFVSAYLAHKLSGAPLVVYEMDEWRASLVGGGINAHISEALEKLFHQRILRAARKVWVMSDQMAEDLSARFGVKAEELPSCIEVDKFARHRHGERANHEEFRIVFTGSVYTPQSGAIRNVLEAIRSRSDVNPSLVIYSSQSEDEITRQGIAGPRLRVERSVPYEKVPELFTDADALLLPFSFDEDQKSVVSTSLPSKSVEYLASGVPVIVHAPPYSTVARLARDEGWAEVVDKPDVGQLGDALARLANDEPLRKRLVTNALRVARSRYDLVRRRREFVASLRTGE